MLLNLPRRSICPLHFCNLCKIITNGKYEPYRCPTCWHTHFSESNAYDGFTSSYADETYLAKETISFREENAIFGIYYRKFLFELRFTTLIYVVLLRLKHFIRILNIKF